MQENSHTSSKPSSSVWQNIRSFYRSIIKHDGQGILVPLFGIILIGLMVTVLPILRPYKGEIIGNHFGSY